MGGPRWYQDTLGLRHQYTFGKLAFFDCGGPRLYLSLESAARGLEFTNAPHLIFRHADGMEEWMAFIKDPEGRPLALMEQVKP